MSTVDNSFNFFFSAETPSRDFRFIPFALVLCYILTLIFAEFYFGSYSAIGNYLAIHPLPYFTDLKVLLCGIDAVRRNGNPYIALSHSPLWPCLVHGRPSFNYPYIWGAFAPLSFITEPNALYIGIALALSFFSFLYFFLGRINLSGAIVYTTLFISPAVMLGVERGNSDLIIFLLLLVPVFYHSSQKLLAFGVLIAAMLKVFPIAAITGIFHRLRDNKKQSLVLFLGVALMFLFYLLLMRDNISVVSQTTPRPYGDGCVCYGLASLMSFFGDYFPYGRPYIRVFYPALIVLGYAFFYQLMGRQLATSAKISSSRHGLSFVVGSSIFILTCLIGYNFEYRLVFLLFTIPQILTWIAEKKSLLFVPLFLSILILWQSFIDMIATQLPFNLHYFSISQVFVTLLFYCHFAILFGFVKETAGEIVPMISTRLIASRLR
jgi:hypothetical protein